MATAVEQRKNDGRGKKPFRNFDKTLEEKGIPILKVWQKQQFLPL
jgi:hypothetical protein